MLHKQYLEKSFFFNLKKHHYFYSLFFPTHSTHKGLNHYLRKTVDLLPSKHERPK